MTFPRDELDDLRASLRRALRTPAPEVAPTVDPSWRARWPALAAIGLTSFCVAERTGGFGNAVPAAVVAAGELGGMLHGSPFAGTTATTFALSRWLPENDRTGPLGPLVSGAEIAALAFLEPGGTVAAAGGAAEVNGRARLVVGASDADVVLVVPLAGETMALLRRSDCQVAPGVPAFDVSRSWADVRLEAVRGVTVSCGVEGRARTERLHNLVLAADTLGGVERVLARTVVYSRERTAFGRPIGGFQAVQHRLVDHAVRVRGMSLLVAAAAGELAAGGIRGALVAEAAVARHAVPVLHDLLQLTGAIGFTWEYGLHLYERRAHLNAAMAYGPRRALRSLAVVEGWAD